MDKQIVDGKCSLVKKNQSLTSATAWMGLKHTTERRGTQLLVLIPFTQSSGTGRTVLG